MSIFALCCYDAVIILNLSTCKYFESLLLKKVYTIQLFLQCVHPDLSVGYTAFNIICDSGKFSS